MKNLRGLSTSQYIRLIAGFVFFSYGMYHLARYTLGYPIAFGIPGTPLYGSGSKIASAYLIISVIGTMIFRGVYDKLPTSSAEG